MTKLFQTQRLYAKHFEIGDLNNLYKLHSNQLVAKTTIDGIQSLETVEKHLKDFISHQENFGFSQWAIFEKSSNKFIGRAGLTKRKLNDEVEEGVEIRFAILPDFWNKGYASELTNSLVEYAKDTLKLKKLIAGNDPKNERSIRILNKYGFKLIKKIIPKGYGVKIEVDYRELIFDN